MRLTRSIAISALVAAACTNDPMGGVKATPPVTTNPDLSGTIYFTQHDTGINPVGGNQDDYEMYIVVPPSTTGNVNVVANQFTAVYMSMGRSAYDTTCRCGLSPGDHVDVWLLDGSAGYGTDAPPLGSMEFWATQVIVTGHDARFSAHAADSVVPRSAFGGTWSDMTFNLPNSSVVHLSNFTLGPPYGSWYIGDSTVGTMFAMDVTREFSGMAGVRTGPNSFDYYWFFGTCPTDNACSATFPGGTVTATR
jgi:hypothetical protein